MLLLTGSLDATNPLENAVEVARGFSNAVSLEVADAMHEALPVPAVQSVIVDWFRGTDVRGRRIVASPPRFLSVEEAAAPPTQRGREAQLYGGLTALASLRVWPEEYSRGVGGARLIWALADRSGSGCRRDRKAVRPRHGALRALRPGAHPASIDRFGNADLDPYAQQRRKCQIRGYNTPARARLEPFRHHPPGGSSGNNHQAPRRRR
jgi:hypothetical protein